MVSGVQEQGVPLLTLFIKLSSGFSGVMLPSSIFGAVTELSTITLVPDWVQLRN
jgi:hypothetical protein